MFKRVVTHKGFWKSFIVLSVIYGIIMYLIQWGLKGEWLGLFKMRPIAGLVFIIGTFLVGFIITYGKFWKKLKEKDYKDKR